MTHHSQPLDHEGLTMGDAEQMAAYHPLMKVYSSTQEILKRQQTWYVLSSLLGKQNSNRKMTFWVFQRSLHYLSSKGKTRNI